MSAVIEFKGNGPSGQRFAIVASNILYVQPLAAGGAMVVFSADKSLNIYEPYDDVVQALKHALDGQHPSGPAAAMTPEETIELLKR
jgi:hypothetical protein